MTELRNLVTNYIQDYNHVKAILSDLANKYVEARKLIKIALMLGYTKDLRKLNNLILDEAKLSEHLTNYLIDYGNKIESSIYVNTIFPII